MAVTPMYFSRVMSTSRSLFASTVGLMNTIRLRLTWLSEVERNRKPSRGISPSSGTLRTVS